MNLSAINVLIDRLRARTFDFFSRGKNWRRRIALFIADNGPGIITSNVDNDAGGIATYTQAGSAYGYALLWALVPMTIALYVTEEMCARMGVITGKGLSDLIREEFGFRSTFFVMVTGFFVDLANVVAEFAGVAAAGQIFGISKYIAVPLAAVIVWTLVLRVAIVRSRSSFSSFAFSI
jgi:NRAMP (natural resistance-associated macrophage protein)-like metal ion transporter